MQGIIDRFEGDWAVIETQYERIRIERKDLPAQAGEGDLLIQKEGIWMIDKHGSYLRKQKVQKLADELWEDQDS